MPPITFPNQRTVRIHRERATADFLGIKNENWQAASRDLGAHALQLYLYLASNANNYNLALSPAAVRQDIGMARSTYHDQFHKLVDRGYLVPSHGNTFEFYEVPQSATQPQNSMTDNGQDFETNPAADSPEPRAEQDILAENIEINNMPNIPNKERINISVSEGQGVIQKLPVKEIIIPPPIAEGRSRPLYSPKPQRKEFVF